RGAPEPSSSPPTRRFAHGGIHVAAESLLEREELALDAPQILVRQRGPLLPDAVAHLAPLAPHGDLVHSPSRLCSSRPRGTARASLPAAAGGGKCTMHAAPDASGQHVARGVCAAER